MNHEKVKAVEQATLKTFKEEIPSIYFSDKTEADFKAYSDNAAYTYRDLLKFPPKMFDGASLIDFGAGTGENTISLAIWGADCTLVEMNDKALAIAKEVFGRYAKQGTHKFIESSIFDYDSNAKYDIVHCRGVLSHTADKRGAFDKIARFVKPGGYLIFGDPNKAGGFQNMLQRFAVYRHATSWDEMVAVCEKLFKEDIDRSQSFVTRTRRSIIFDRWVIQSQDDPSVEEVLSWLSENGLALYSSYPPFMLPLLGDSVHHRPKFDATNVKGMASLAQTIWLLQKDGDRENIKALDENCVEYADRLAALTSYLQNLNAQSSLDPTQFNQLADDTVAAFSAVSIVETFQRRLAEFITEAKTFVHLVHTAGLDDLRAFILTCKHLFRGACGVRHVDFIAYKKS
jgi:2-polyprenyl-3-methyl-5-hydroxy-6-metoxy-1,4-benzoquinol methylase